MITYEEKLARKRAKYGSDLEVRRKRSAEAKVYYQLNREEIKNNVKRYRNDNKGLIKEKRKVYRLQPEKITAANLRSRKYRSNPENKQVLAHRAMQYYSRKYQAIGFSTKEKLKARWDYYAGKCWLCKEIATEMDHIKPLSKGGTNWPANLRPICRSCNARKSNIWPFQSITTQGEQI